MQIAILFTEHTLVLIYISLFLFDNSTTLNSAFNNYKAASDLTGARLQRALVLFLEVKQGKDMPIKNNNGHKKNNPTLNGERGQQRIS